MKPSALSSKITSLLAFIGFVFLAAAAILTFLALFFTSTSRAGTITFGTPKELHVRLLGIDYGNKASYLGEAQQVYDGSLFRGAGLITQIAFMSWTAGVGMTRIYQLSLSLGITAKTPSLTGSAFETKLTPVLSGTVQANFTALPYDYDFSITLPTPFYYDPALGNLVMDIVRSDVTVPVSDPRQVTFWGEEGSTAIGQIYVCQPTYYCAPNSIQSRPNSGLVTQFTTAPVPEPGAAGRVFLGAALCGGRRLRDRNFAILTLLALLFTSTSHAATITTAGGNSMANYPFGINNAGTAIYTAQYQQIYRKTLFASRSLITQIAFKDASSVPWGDVSYTLSIGLGVTSRTTAAPGTGFATGAAPVFTGTAVARITPAAGDFDVVFALDTPFLYDPALGNLLLDVAMVSASGAPGNAGMSFVALAVDTSDMARISDFGKGIVAQPLWGVATQFTTAPVPEPATAALLFLGAALCIPRRGRANRS